ncbi:MAG: transcription termination factor Rho [Verrucomicrobiales bacterium]|nr:transcription termination factor Rho [Verrucomicrobiales bacterium]
MSESQPDSNPSPATEVKKTAAKKPAVKSPKKKAAKKAASKPRISKEKAAPSEAATPTTSKATQAPKKAEPAPKAEASEQRPRSNDAPSSPPAERQPDNVSLEGPSRSEGGDNSQRPKRRQGSDSRDRDDNRRQQNNRRGNNNKGRGGRNRNNRRRNNQGGNNQGGNNDRNDRGEHNERSEAGNDRRNQNRQKQREPIDPGPPVEATGLVEISPKGFGFLRQESRNYQQSPNDVFITPEIVRAHSLRDGVMVKCTSQLGNRGPQLTDLLEINGKAPEAYHNLPYFEELTAINPCKRYALETRPDRYTTRVIDMMAPIGRGQRGLIVAPPRTGKTTILQHIAEAVLENYEDEVHLMVLLVDERPEEVTDFKRSLPGAEVMASSNDANVKDHTRIAQLAIERAKRLVEAGEHVFILLDSITRLARAFNNATKGKGRGTASGGLSVGALEIPRRLFAAARNTREAGSLTIIATALIETNSRMDDAIFQEFKGTGNMELVLNRYIAQNYIYPAVDINKSGTRREELLLAPHMLEKIQIIRRGLAGHKPEEAMQRLLSFLERFNSNAQMLMEIKNP